MKKQWAKNKNSINMKKKIAVILGDGIGPEVTQQSIKVLNKEIAQLNDSIVKYSTESSKLKLNQIQFIRKIMTQIYIVTIKLNLF